MESISPRLLVELFELEVAKRNGQVVDVFHDSDRLFARSLLHEKRALRRRDDVEGGVAICLLRQKVSIRPYIFRLICSNGAVMALSQDAVEIDVRQGDLEEHRPAIQEGIAACASAEAFSGGVEQMRRTVGMRPDLSMMMVQLMRSGLHDFGPSTLLDILEEYRQEGTDVYAFMNGLTATARRQADPERRWRLEEAGGSIPALLVGPQRVMPPAFDWLEDLHVDRLGNLQEA